LFNFAQFFQDILRDSGWSQGELAKWLGCSRLMVNQYTSGLSIPSADKLKKIETELGLPHQFLQRRRLIKIAHDEGVELSELFTDKELMKDCGVGLGRLLLVDNGAPPPPEVVQVAQAAAAGKWSDVLSIAQDRLARAPKPRGRQNPSSAQTAKPASLRETIARNQEEKK
jgi:transcriptional regulator with XRE-family HTH domain